LNESAEAPGAFLDGKEPERYTMTIKKNRRNRNANGSRIIALYFNHVVWLRSIRVIEFKSGPLTSISKQWIPRARLLFGNFELKISEWAGCGCLGLYQTLAHKKLSEQAVPPSHTTELDEK
jgi:hypothetical protein